MTNELSTSKSVLVIAVVFGCFAVLWPKIFYPMFFGNSSNSRPYEDSTSFPDSRPPHLGHPHPHHPGMRPGDPRMRNPNIEYDENGLPKRTLERELRPGPVPGMRPAMGGPGMHPQPQRQSQQGAMSILMPLYTVGIVIFFVYTIMKLLFKKDEARGAGGGSRDPLSSYYEEQEQQQQQQQQQAHRKQQMHGGAEGFQNYGQHSQQQQVRQPQCNHYREDLAEEPEDDDDVPSDQEEESPPPGSPAKRDAEATTPGGRPLATKPDIAQENAQKDEEIRVLKDRLQTTEKALQLIMEKLDTIQQVQTAPVNAKRKAKKNDRSEDSSRDQGSEESSNDTEESTVNVEDGQDKVES